MSKGLFITFEGGEGAGKSSVIASLKVALEEKGITAHTTREPGGCALGESIRTLLLDSEKLCTQAELLLFLANRAQHVQEVILPKVAAGTVVLCDRFTDSTLAYQGAARQQDDALLQALSSYATGGVDPDLTFLIDVPVEVGMKRVESNRDGKDRIEQESLDFHNRVRDGYLALARANPGRFRVIDGTQSLQEVTDAVQKEVFSHV